jgi:histidinol-phosphatase
MASPADPELLELARTMAEAAGRLTLRWFRRPDLTVDRKSDGSPVTVADRAAEDHVRAELARLRPGDAIVGEEHGQVAGDTGLTWIVDPIDGTEGFARGVPLYSTLIALVDEVGPAIGVIHLPALQSTLSAGRGLGCWVDGRTARVSVTAELGGSLLTTSGFDAFSHEELAAVRSCGARLRTWGDGYGYYMVATGDADVMIDPIAYRWDLAPMPVILGEAGGRFSTRLGEAAFDRLNGIATNGVLHDEVLGVFGPGRRPE